MDNKSIFQELQEIQQKLIDNTTAPQVTGQSSTPAPQTPAVVEPTAVAPNVESATPVEPSKPAEPVATTAPDVDLVVDANSWDSDTSKATPSTPQGTTSAAPAAPVVEDFSSLANVLGKEKITSKDELVAAVNEIKSKADVLTKLPETLSKAVEIAQQGGNYLEYLGVSVVDWGKEDPITLYENYVIDQYTQPDGQVDWEKVDKLLDKIDDDDKELRGRELQRQYTNYQTQQKAFYESQAKASQAAFEGSLRKSIEGLSEIAGFKLSPSHKEEIYSYIVKGEDLRQADVNQRIFNAFVTKYWNKIDGYRKTQIKNSSMKKILDDIQVPDIKPVGEPVVDSNTQKGYSLQNYLEDLSKGKKY